MKNVSGWIRLACCLLSIGAYAEDRFEELLKEKVTRPLSRTNARPTDAERFAEAMSAFTNEPPSERLENGEPVLEIFRTVGYVDADRLKAVCLEYLQRPIDGLLASNYRKEEILVWESRLRAVAFELLRAMSLREGTFANVDVDSQPVIEISLELLLNERLGYPATKAILRNLLWDMKTGKSAQAKHALKQVGKSDWLKVLNQPSGDKYIWFNPSSKSLEGVLRVLTAETNSASFSIPASEALVSALTLLQVDRPGETSQRRDSYNLARELLELIRRK